MRGVSISISTPAPGFERAVILPLSELLDEIFYNRKAKAGPAPPSARREEGLEDVFKIGFRYAATEVTNRDDKTLPAHTPTSISTLPPVSSGYA